MKKNYRMIVKLMTGMVVAAVLLGACKLGGGSQKDPPPAPTPTPAPPEMETLSFMVRTITESKNLKGFSTFKNGLKLPVSVPKGQTVASKQTIINAIKVKAPELQEVALELYRGSNKKSSVYDENDPALKNNSSVYVGKANYSNTVSITVKSVGVNNSLYLPIAAYGGEGKTVSDTVADTATESAIAAALRGAIQRDTGSSYFDTYYKLFKDETATIEAPDSLFTDGGTVYIGKRQNTARVTVKTIDQGKTVQVPITGGGTIDYHQVIEYAGEGKVFTAVIADNADTKAIAAALLREIKDRMGGAQYFDTLYKLFKKGDGSTEEITDADLKDGGTVYIGQKDRTITVSFKSIAADITVTHPASGAVAEFKVASLQNYKAGAAFPHAMTLPVAVHASAQDIANKVDERLQADLGANYAETYYFYKELSPIAADRITPKDNPSYFGHGCTVYMGKKVP